MKIEKYKDNKWFYNYYVDSKTNDIPHGLDNYYSWWGIGYCYHGEHKGFWVINEGWL